LRVLLTWLRATSLVAGEEALGEVVRQLRGRASGLPRIPGLARRMFLDRGRVESPSLQDGSPSSSRRIHQHEHTAGTSGSSSSSSPTHTHAHEPTQQPSTSRRIKRAPSLLRPQHQHQPIPARPQLPNRDVSDCYTCDSSSSRPRCISPCTRRGTSAPWSSGSTRELGCSAQSSSRSLSG